MESVVFNHTNHKKLWLWLAENPEKNKEDWHGWNSSSNNAKKSKYNCFACDYDDDLQRNYCNSKRKEVCEYCPLIWPDNGNDKYTIKCGGPNGLFEKWGCSITFVERSELALQIANLSVKKGIATI